MSLAQLDGVITELAGTLHATCPLPEWSRVVLTAKYSPGGVSGHDYDYVLPSGDVDRGAEPDAAGRHRVRELTGQHLRLTRALGQPAWFKMIVTVERSGRYAVDFAYMDHVTDQDMVQRG